jgi:hypothetical protein
MLLERKLTPPYKPETTEDLAYFDQKLVTAGEITESVLPAAARNVIAKDAH